MMLLSSFDGGFVKSGTFCLAAEVAVRSLAYLRACSVLKTLVLSLCGLSNL